MSRRAVSVGVALTALGVALWLAGDRLVDARFGGSAGSRPPPSDAQGEATKAKRRTHLDVKRAGVGAAEPEQRDALEPGEDRAVADYLESSKYPPTSRPLRDTDAHLVAWNRRHERPRATDADARLSVLFTADRFFVIGDGALDVRFEAQGAALASLVVTAAPDREGATTTPIEMRSDGEGRWVGRFTPASTDVTRHRLTATFATDAGVLDEASFNVEHTPRGAEPARFTGEHRSALEEGSLAVYVGVDVREAGYYLFDANLFAGDAPVAWTRFKGPLEVGPREVRLLFFGKVLTDHRAASGGADEPLHVTELRGARYREDAEPELAQLVPMDRALDTGLTLGAPFSDAAWASAHKEAKLARLRELAASGRGIALPR